MTKTTRSARDIVASFSQSLPVNIEEMIRALGIELDKKAELHDEISGQIEQIEAGRYKISINRSHHYYRQRFTMAHELAHFLLHRSLIEDGLDDSIAYRSTPSGTFYNQNITSQHETQANKLAAQILMPATAVRELVEQKKSIHDMSRLFQTSERAVEIRLSTLQLTAIR